MDGGRSRFVRVLAALVATLALAAAGIAQPNVEQEARRLMRLVIDAPSRLRYTGVRVIEFRSLGDRERRIEIVWRDGLRQRVEFPPDSALAGQVIVETAAERRHFFPEANQIRVSKPKFEAGSDRLSGILAGARDGRFRIAAADGETIAGIRTKKLEVSDRENNVLQRLFVDPGTGLVLRRELFDLVGTRVGLMEFQEIDYRPNLRDDDFAIKRRGAEVVNLDQILERMARELGMRPYRLPASEFGLDDVRKLQVGDQAILEQVYRQPQGAISLFQVKGEVNPRALRRRAGPNAAVHAWRIGQASLVLIGNVPQAILQRMARRVSE